MSSTIGLIFWVASSTHMVGVDLRGYCWRWRSLLRKQRRVSINPSLPTPLLVQALDPPRSLLGSVSSVLPVKAVLEGPMDVLIDTNVFIEREQDSALREPLQELEHVLNSKSHTILVHPLSKEEIRAYENEERREIAESKIATYAELPLPDYPTSSDTEFREYVPEAHDDNEQVDNALLFATYDGQVDYLVTEDKGIHRKAERLDIADRVLRINEGPSTFADDEPAYNGPPSIQSLCVRELDIDDPIFNSLKEEYEDFEEWIRGIPDREAYVNWNADDTLGAVLILKPNEVEPLGEDGPLPPRDRLKICTLKVSEDRRGSKIGELLVSIAIREAIDEELEEMYLTHRIRPDDHLVQLISEYGFRRAAKKATGESVFLKRLKPGPDDDPDPMETNIRFYPTFYDGPDVDKFIVPIIPRFHDRLFQDYDKRRTKLRDFSGQFYPEGNTIKKAYLTHAPTRQIDRGDLLLFYRSRDHQELTSVGVCDCVEYEVDSGQEVETVVGRRSVFTSSEIEEQVTKPTTVIMFKWHSDLNNPLHFQVLEQEDVIASAPQSIQQLDDSGYEYVKTAGGIDERFTIN